MCTRLVQVSWSEDRFIEIQEEMKPFLQIAGFSASKTVFLPVAAMTGLNLTKSADIPELKEWFSGGTLMDQLGTV